MNDMTYKMTTEGNGVRVAANAMRTRFEIVLYDGARSEADLRAAGEEALAEVARVESWLSIYWEDAVLYGVNAEASHRPVRVAAPVFAFLEQALSLTKETGGAFDLAAGALVRLWRDAGEVGRVPTPHEIMEAQARCGMAQVVVLDADKQTVRFTMPSVRLDPGAMGKGYALDRAAELLRDMGINAALLHGGTSSVVAIGVPPNSPKGWQVAVQHPKRPGKHLATFFLRDNALGVSAVQGRTFYAEGRTFGHILDPRTGWPVEKSLLYAQTDSSAAIADALSTARLVTGSPIF